MENREEELHRRVFAPFSEPAFTVFKWSAAPHGNLFGLPFQNEAVALDHRRLSSPGADIL